MQEDSGSSIKKLPGRLIAECPTYNGHFRRAGIEQRA